MSSGAVTEFGFDWGPMSVTRCCELPDGYVMQIKTASKAIDVYVTRAGRNIRVFNRQGRQGEWLSPDALKPEPTEEAA